VQRVKSPPLAQTKSESASGDGARWSLVVVEQVGGEEAGEPRVLGQLKLPGGLLHSGDWRCRREELVMRCWIGCVDRHGLFGGYPAGVAGGGCRGVQWT